MKNFRTLLSIMLCIISINLFAQNPSPDKERKGGKWSDEKREQIESMKIAFITKKLNLTPDEAKRFWPVYNQYSEEKRKLREDRFSGKRDAKDNFDTMSDKDAEKIVDAEITSRQQELDLVKKYHLQFKQVLPIKKVAQLYRAEDEFKKELIEKIKEKRKSDK